MAIVRSLIMPAARRSAGGITFAKVRGNQVMKQKILTNRSNTDEQSQQRWFFRAVVIFVQQWYATLARWLPRTRHGSAWNNVLSVALRSLAPLVRTPENEEFIRTAISEGRFTDIAKSVLVELATAAQPLWIYGKSRPVGVKSWNVRAGLGEFSTEIEIGIEISLPSKFVPSFYRGGVTLMVLDGITNELTTITGEFSGQLTISTTGASAFIQVFGNVPEPARFLANADNVALIAAFQLKENRKWQQYSFPMVFGLSGTGVDATYIGTHSELIYKDFNHNETTELIRQENGNVTINCRNDSVVVKSKEKSEKDFDMKIEAIRKAHLEGEYVDVVKPEKPCKPKRPSVKSIREEALKEFNKGKC